jgi:hypothetical protein
MNPTARDYLNDKKFLGLWAPYLALLSQVREFTGALFDALANREEISGSMLRDVAQDILSKAILTYPVHQIEKIAYRINETLKGIINSLEDSYPHADLRQARVELNHFEGMQAYAQKIAKTHDWHSFISLVKVIGEQRVGSKNPDAEFANQVLGALLELDDTQGLDEFVASTTQVEDLFNPPRFKSYAMKPSMLIHALQRVVDGTYSLDRPEVSGILKVLFFSLGEPTGVMGGEESILRAVEAIDQHFEDDEAKFQLVSGFNRAFHARDESTNRDCLNPFYFAVLIKPDKPHYLQAMIQDTFKSTWSSRAAVDACLQRKDGDCPLGELIIKMINMPVQKANEWTLCYNFTTMFESMLNLPPNSFPNEDYYRVDWRSCTLDVNEPNGKLLVRVLTELLPAMAINAPIARPDGELAQDLSMQVRFRREMDRDVLRRLKESCEKDEGLQLYWAAIVACGEADAARQLLNDFWKGNFKALKAWVDAFKDDMTHYEQYEWVNDERLQADLGL